MRYSDRTRTELDWTCPRARYYSTEYDGIGLAPLEKPQELQFGGAMADQLANIKRGLPWDAEAFAFSDKPLGRALLTAYEEVVWPNWLRQFDLLSVEEENPLVFEQLGEKWLTYNSRPDTIMRRKSDQTVWYAPEDKTTAYVDSLIAYANNIQLHATAHCIEQNHPEWGRVAGCIVQGMDKGFVKEGKLYHPLVTAYCKEGRPGIIPDQWSLKWTRSWERTPVEQYDGGIRAFIKQVVKPDDLAGLFPCSEPVTINRPLVEAYFRQVQQREMEIATYVGLDKKMEDVFPQHFNQCDQFGKSRKPCVFKPLCFNATARKFPMTFYTHREPHHLNEQESLCSKSNTPSTSAK